jgi:hypothetical protein
MKTLRNLGTSGLYIFLALFLFQSLCDGRAPSLQLRAQLPTATDSKEEVRASLARQIKLVIRSQMNVPPDWEITVGERKPTTFPGYDTLEVSFDSGKALSQKQTISFLISKDSLTLARLSQYSLTEIPGTLINVSDRPIRGDQNAPVDVVVFDDLECPFCAQLHSHIFPDTLDQSRVQRRSSNRGSPMGTPCCHQR